MTQTDHAALSAKLQAIVYRECEWLRSKADALRKHGTEFPAARRECDADALVFDRRASKLINSVSMAELECRVRGAS